MTDAPIENKGDNLENLISQSLEQANNWGIEILDKKKRKLSLNIFNHSPKIQHPYS